MSKRTIYAVVIVLVVAGVLLWSLGAYLKRVRELAVNPFAYKLDAATGAAAAGGRFRETGRLTPGIDDPHGLATDGQGRVYVCGASAVVVLDAEGRELRRFALPGPGRCLAVDDAGRVLVGLRDHVRVFGPGGDELAQWVPLGDRAVVTSLAVGRSGVYVADFGNRRVWHFDAGGKLLRSVGPDPGGGGQYVLPSASFDVAVDADDTLWVAHAGRQRVERYGVDGVLASFWGRASMEPDGFCGCCNPSHLAIAVKGRFVTSEKGLPRVKVYSADGVLEAVVAGPDAFREGAVGLDLAVDPAGRILVLDPGEGVVRVFEPVEGEDA